MTRWRKKNRYTYTHTHDHRRCLSFAALVTSRYQPATSNGWSRDWTKNGWSISSPYLGRSLYFLIKLKEQYANIELGEGVILNSCLIYHISTNDRKLAENVRWAGNFGESSVTIRDITSKSDRQLEYGYAFVASSI